MKNIGRNDLQPQLPARRNAFQRTLSHPAQPALWLGATLLCAFPALAQPDLKKGGMASEKAKDKAALKAPDNDLAIAKMGATPNKIVSFTEQSVRMSLQAQGITDEKTVNAVIEHVGRLEEARKAITEKANALRANIKPNTAIADAQFNVMLNDYLAAVEDYKIIREKSEQQLNEKIAYTKNSRLYAALLVGGFIGDAPQNGNANYGLPQMDLLNNLIVGNNAPLNFNWAPPPGAQGVWNFQGNINGQPFAFDQNGAVPPNGNLLIPPGAVPGQPLNQPLGQPFVFQAPQFPNANVRDLMRIAPNNIDPAIIKQWQTFGNGQNGMTIVPGGVPNPFNKIAPDNQADIQNYNAAQLKVQRQEFDEKLKDLQAQLDLLKAEQKAKNKAEKTEKNLPADKDETAPKVEKLP